MNKNSATADLPDGDLASQAAAGSRPSFEELVSRYAPRLFYFLRAKSQTDQDIEDLVQEAFLRAFQNIDRYDSRWKFSTWLYTLAVRLAISRYRSQKTKLFQMDPESPECPSLGPQEIMIEKEEAQKHKNIWNLAASLDPRQYEALWLRYAEDMSIKDIARAMKKTQAGVRVLLHRARLNLGEKLRAPAPSIKVAEKEETSYAMLNL